ncbi:MAG: AMP-dependent synthetase and ligase [Caulobacteraceae bacterium]|nr:AMP-dependent synthetase and ligase [Caulobacteraceae bacterium]
MTAASTIWDLLARGEDDAVAIAASSAGPLTYQGLREQVDETVNALNAAGIGRGDRVAIVLPNGPETAAAFLGVAAGATSAPLNPQYRAEELEFYLTDLAAKALVVEAGAPAAASEVAARLGIPVIALEATPEKGAGRFRLDAGAAPGGAPASGGPAAPSDVALVLHTSGTTSRPKIVPLTHANVCASASNVSRTLALTAADRGLVVMPLFHIHGLIAGVLAPLLAGGSVFCAPGFNALRFFGWVSEARPTWYTAVPTMHQAILARAGHNPEVIAASPLRFIRSSSSSLPARVLAELEATFGTRVIESYGMTEAAHQMTSNLLAPGERKPGTVGVASGPDVAIMDDAGQILPQGRIGEIVIRGDNVTLGYENNPKANAEAFAHGWFRTGDQGAMDADGFLTITGRLKEIIDRGGEKISPREVDEVLMDHPAVLQVVTFAIPHDKLGEEVGAAVVLRDGHSVAERDLRDYVAGRLAHFKVPRKVIFLDEIPKGPTGKLQRIGLAQKLGL